MYIGIKVSRAALRRGLPGLKENRADTWRVCIGGKWFDDQGSEDEVSIVLPPHWLLDELISHSIGFTVY